MKNQDKNLYYAISRTINMIQRDAEKIFSKYDLTRGQFSIMEVLHKNGELCIGNVQETILMTGGNIPVIVNNLIKKGLLVRKQDEADRRRYLLRLTDAGNNLISKVIPEHDALIKEFFSSVGSNEKNTLINIFNDLSAK